MAFNPSNSNWIASYSSDGTNITIPIASIPLLSSAEAHTTTGDIRKFLLALCHMLAAKYVSEGANIPTKMIIQSSASLQTDGVTVIRTYSFQFTNTIASDEVATE